MAKSPKDDLAEALAETASAIRATLGEILEASAAAPVARRAEALVALNALQARLTGLKKKVVTQK
jgi:hypothetical protein